MALQDKIRRMTAPAYRWHAEHGERIFDMAEVSDTALHDEGWRSTAKEAAAMVAEVQIKATADDERNIRAEMFAKARSMGLKPGGRITTDNLAKMLDEYENANMQSDPENSA